MTDSHVLSFPPEYYCDEVRDGFFVSEAMKRFWAAQMVVLSEIGRICRKYDLNWYADSGTMLGAVRHKGYIPWDDDIDISMFRGDYDKFMEVARGELSDDYVILTSENDDFYFPFGKIRNRGAFFFDEDRTKKFQGCPFSVGVDIFPLDNVYDDAAKEADRYERGRLIFATIEGIVAKTMSDGDIKKNVELIEKDNNVHINSKNPLKDVKRVFEKLAREANDQDSEDVVVMVAWFKGDGCRYKRAYYSHWEDMPYEYTTIRVPTQYHEILTDYYGDYMKPVKGTAFHTYLSYRETEYRFREKYGRNPTFRYHFDKESFLPKEIRKSFNIQQKELLTYMRGFHENISEKICIQEVEEAAKYLETCQNAAVTIGNAIEGKFGEGIEAVAALEDYCEIVYEASLNWNNESKKRLDESLAVAEAKMDELFESSKKEILLLLCRSCWWDSIKDVFAEATSNEENNVHAIPIPYSFLDHTKKLLGWKTDSEEFEKISELGGKLTSYEEYRPEIRRPDVIVIQYPYDGWSGILAIPEQLFSQKLLDYTDELIFVPFLEPDPPTSTEDVAYLAMNELVEQPAVFNSDRVMVRSEQFRNYYIQKLVDMTDENLREYWMQRISLKENL